MVHSKLTPSQPEKFLADFRPFQFLERGLEKSGVPYFQAPQESSAEREGNLLGSSDGANDRYEKSPESIGNIYN